MLYSHIILLVTYCHWIFISTVASVDNTTTKKGKVNEIVFDSGYVMTPGVGAHKYHKTLVSWNDARKICISEGAHLAVINSALEESIISKYQVDNQLNDLWIGIHAQFKKDDWVTVKDQPIDAIGYLHWCNGEPNNAGGNERCLVYSPKYNPSYSREGMNDLSCDQGRGFICEIDLNDCSIDFYSKHICPSLIECPECIDMRTVDIRRK